MRSNPDTSTLRNLSSLIPCVICLLLTSCAPAPARNTAPGSPRLVVLYATCSLNRSFVEPYNSDVSFTPGLAAFGRDAVVFDRHHTEAGKSSVAFSSIYTASHAYTHGVYLQGMKMRDDVVMLTEAFAAAGYDTHFWDNHPMAKKKLNFAQGVDENHTYSTYDEPGARARDATLTSAAPELLAILERLTTDPDYRALIISNNAVPHSPYYTRRIDELRDRHPDEVTNLNDQRIADLGKLYSSNHLRLQHNYHPTIDEFDLDRDDEHDLSGVIESAYKVGVAELDALFAGVVQTIDDHGLRNQSLIAFTSDHGELMDRPTALTRWTHGWETAPEVIHVPLMIRLPGGIRGGARIETVTRSIDLYPTLAGLADVDVSHAWNVSGVDLSAAVAGDEPPPKLDAYFHSVSPTRRVLKHINEWQTLTPYYPDSDIGHVWVGRRRGDNLVILRPDASGTWHCEAYDLATDAGLEHDIFDAGDSDHAAVAEALAEYKAQLVERFKKPQQAGDPEELKMLRSLGYVQ